MFLPKQTHMFDYFICYHPESGWHVTKPNQGLSLRERKEPGNEDGVIANDIQVMRNDRRVTVAGR